MGKHILQHSGEDRTGISLFAGTGFMPAFISFLAVLFFLCVPVSGETEKTDPHSDVKKQEFCLRCHSAAEVRSFSGQTDNPCSESCLSCHQILDTHHPVNKRPAGKKNSSLILEKERVTCITCHRISGKRYDTEPWASRSMYDRLFKRSSEYKTYFLIMKNDDGQLCKSCH